MGSRATLSSWGGPPNESKRGKDWFQRGRELRAFLIQEFLKAREDLADLARIAQFGDGVSEGIVILQAKQWRQLFGIEFFHASAHIVREHKLKKDLLRRREMCADSELCLCRTLLATKRREQVSHIGIRRSR